MGCLTPGSCCCPLYAGMAASEIASLNALHPSPASFCLLVLCMVVIASAGDTRVLPRRCASSAWLLFACIAYILHIHFHIPSKHALHLHLALAYTSCNWCQCLSQCAFPFIPWHADTCSPFDVLMWHAGWVRLLMYGVFGQTKRHAVGPCHRRACGHTVTCMLLFAAVVCPLKCQNEQN